MKMTHASPQTWWRDRREDVFAWLILASAAFVGCLLALVAWHWLVA